MRICYSLLALVLLISCSSEKESVSFFTSDLKDFVADTLFFEKDLETKALPLVFTYQKSGGKEMLSGMVGYKLLQYDYQTGDLMNSHSFEKEGPNGIGGFISGNLVTEEGIFFISDQKQLIYSDFDGQIKDRLPLPQVPDERLAVNFSTMRGNPMAYDKEIRTLMAADVPFVLKEPNMQYEDWVWQFDWEKRESMPVKFSYPEKYREYYDDIELGVYAHTYSPGLKTHVVSFPVSDSLLVIDSEEKRWVSSKSTSEMTFQKGVVQEFDGFTAFLPSEETSRYKWILHDPYRDLWLRYVNLETKGEKDENRRNKSSFIVHDSNFQVMAELFFDNQQIAPEGFATPDGFFFKLLNPASDDVEVYVRVIFDFW